MHEKEEYLVMQGSTNSLKIFPDIGSSTTMILLKLLVLGLVSSVFASTDYTLDIGSHQRCFPVYANERIHITLQNYTLEPEFKDSSVALPFAFYREKDADHKRTYAGETSIHYICDQETIERGYCPEASQGQWVRTMLTELGEPVIISGIQENGVYCVFAPGFKFDDYKVVITVDDGYKTSLKSRQVFKVALFNFVTLLINCLTFIYIWREWSSLNNKNPPFVIRLLQIYFGLRILSRTVYMLPQSFVILDIDLESEYAASTKMLDTMSQLIKATIGYVFFFYVYQYSADFTFDKPDTLEQVKTFIIVFSIKSILIFKGFIGSTSTVLNVISKTTSRCLFIFKVVFIIKIYLRYRSSAKEFQKFKRTDDPKLRQFRWLFLSRLFMNFYSVIVAIIMGIGIGITKVLPNYITKFYMIDNEIFMFHYYMDVPFDVAIVILDYYVFNVIWSPESYEKTIAFKASLD